MTTNAPPPLSNLYYAMYRIRRFEETVLENFPKGVFFGTTHTYLGQEANAVGVLSQIEPGDVVFSNHRCHGHFLAYGGDMNALFAELMGKASGVCGGRGGSQHLHWQDFYSNGVQGGIVPIATGMALAEKIKGSGKIVVTFLGDGTLGEGIIYETFNMASLWKAPILYVVENNKIAQTTPSDMTIAGSIRARLSAFDIPTEELDSSDVRDIYALAGEQISATRNRQRPHALILNTCRFGPHSKGDDTRPPELVENMRRQRDPLKILMEHTDSAMRKALEAQVEEEVSTAYEKARNDPWPETADLQGWLV